MAGLWRRLRRGRGFLRSLLTYHKPGRRRRLTRLYAPFVQEGGLCFDVGAHVGDRSAALHALGSRVVAVEPQPDFAAFLRRVFRRRPGVVVEEAAVAAVPGWLDLFVSDAHPTVTTGSKAFLAAVAAVPSFGAVRWDGRRRVPATTLDLLIARHGAPDFVKLDVEGMEAEALKGLTSAVPALSFEFIPGNKAASEACLEELDRLGPYRFNAALGETGRLVFKDWRDRAGIAAWLAGHPADGPSGDVYAVLGAAGHEGQEHFRDPEQSL
ncbi:MAG: FkbM family methyltransferase [Geminicoccaceae bacterium]|nr:FkbM family methyltransferase [Geminicoccaceae bacterium]